MTLMNVSTGPYYGQCFIWFVECSLSLVKFTVQWIRVAFERLENAILLLWIEILLRSEWHGQFILILLTTFIVQNKLYVFACVHVQKSISRLRYCCAKISIRQPSSYHVHKTNVPVGSLYQDFARNLIKELLAFQFLFFVSQHCCFRHIS